MSQDFTQADRDICQEKHVEHSVKRDSSLFSAVSEFTPHHKRRALNCFRLGVVTSSVRGDGIWNLEDAFKFVDIFLLVSHRCICTFEMLKAWFERAKDSCISVELLRKILDIYPEAYTLSYQHVLNISTGVRELKLVIDSPFKNIPRIKLVKAIMERRCIFRQRLLETESCSSISSRLKFEKDFIDSLRCGSNNFNIPACHSTVEFFESKSLLSTYLRLDKKAIGRDNPILAQRFKNRSILSDQLNVKVDQSGETMFDTSSSGSLPKNSHEDGDLLGTLIFAERGYKQQIKSESLEYQNEDFEYSLVHVLQLVNMIWSFFSTSRKSICLYSGLTRQLTYVHKNPAQTLDETRTQLEFIFRTFPFWISLYQIEGEEWVKIVKSPDVFSQVQRRLKGTTGVKRR